tara:strand:+ start:1310 stop:3109 length:1800 start_codon:yes stop_codon:yes gene_type:complete
MAHNKNIKYTNRDFDSIKSALVTHAQRYYPDRYKDFAEASFGSMFFDSVAYVGDMLSFYLDYQINESFLTTATDFNNVKRLAESIGYKKRGNPSSFGIVSFFIITPANSNGLGVDNIYLPILKKNSTFSGGGSGFILLNDVDFAGFNTETVVARVDTTTGLPTHYAVKAFGKVMSGNFKSMNISIGDFERYKKITMFDTKVTKILSVTDSEGHIYHEVDNLAQSVIYSETTNSNFRNDGVPSILKPVVAPRRFTLSEQGEDSVLQFGHGSDDEEVVENILDPTSVLVQRHGFSYNTNKNFDPFKLINNDSLGISPANTTLTITYIENNSGNSNLAPNQLNQRGDLDFFFDTPSSFPSNYLQNVQSVEGSLELTNESQIIGSTFSVDSSEELRIRALSHYSSQNRAVTKIDYESLVYLMDPSFGSVSRVSVINDPSSSNRRLSMYVTSQDQSGNLTESNGTIKNNIKAWLVNYKMLNDIIDIFDARIVNFGFNFKISVNPGFDPEQVLIECKRDLATMFQNKLYIGEPLYLAKIYNAINKVEGVSDCLSVVPNIKVGSNYANAVLSIDDIISPDGTYLKVPKNVIMELKYPSLDMIGSTV